MGWAAAEFEEVDLGDKRLDARLVKLSDTLSEAPESPINQACADWTETKAAYRFFQNENVDVGEIMAAHRAKTATRAAAHSTVLAIQDTSYLVYTNHPKTKGLGKMSLKKGQNIYIQDTLPVEEKESYRWIEALEATTAVPAETQVVTVCDRECDFYDFFKAAEKINTPVLVRAAQNRTLNRASRYAEKEVAKLWDHMQRQPEAGSYIVEVSAREKTRHCKGRVARAALMGVKFETFRMNPPRNNPKHGSETLPDIQMYAIHVLEKHPPEGEAAVEWMLLTNRPVRTLDEACERVRWYSLRWRIEMYFKVLKSGFRVEACRLGSAERLARYLSVMSIVAWRLFMVTLIARTHPSRPCSTFLSETEWKVLAIKITRNAAPPETVPTIADAVTWIARLGGHLARKWDGPPGTLTLWRGGSVSPI